MTSLLKPMQINIDSYNKFEPEKSLILSSQLYGNLRNLDDIRLTLTLLNTHRNSIKL